MKLTKSILKDLIKEEIEASLEEQGMRGIGTLTPIERKPKFPGDKGQYDISIEGLKDEHDSLQIRRDRLAKKLDALFKARKENADNPAMSAKLAKQISDARIEIDALQNRMRDLVKSAVRIKRRGPGFGEKSAFPTPPKVSYPDIEMDSDVAGMTPEKAIDRFERATAPGGPFYPSEREKMRSYRDPLPKLKKIKESRIKQIIVEEIRKALQEAAADKRQYGAGTEFIYPGRGGQPSGYAIEYLRLMRDFRKSPLEAHREWSNSHPRQAKIAARSFENVEPAGGFANFDPTFRRLRVGTKRLGLGADDPYASGMSREDGGRILKALAAQDTIAQDVKKRRMAGAPDFPVPKAKGEESPGGFGELRGIARAAAKGSKKALAMLKSKAKTNQRAQALLDAVLDVLEPNRNLPPALPDAEAAFDDI